MGSYTLLSGYPPLVTTCLPDVFVAITWSPPSTSFSLALSSRVPLTSFSLCSFGLPLWPPPPPLITVRHMLFGFSSDELRCLPRVFPYLLNLSNFLVWCQRNDYCFRSVPPSALKLLACLRSRTGFYLPLFFKRFLSQRSRRFLHRQWGANGIIGHVSGGSFKLNF